MGYREYNKEQFIEAVKTSKSIAEVLRTLNLVPLGGNYQTVHKNIARYQLNTDHFTGQLWSKGLQLKDINNYTRTSTLKPHLIKERGHRCEICKLSEWLTKPIPLEVHHIDGSSFNNYKDNLQILCCNCHATTDSWRKHKDQFLCLKSSLAPLPKYKFRRRCSCGNIISSKAKNCIKCRIQTCKHQTKINWPSTDTLKELLKTKSKVQLAKELGVSDNAINKRLKRY